MRNRSTVVSDRVHGGWQGGVNATVPTGNRVRGPRTDDRRKVCANVLGRTTDRHRVNWRDPFGARNRSVTDQEGSADRKCSTGPAEHEASSGMAGNNIASGGSSWGRGGSYPHHRGPRHPCTYTGDTLGVFGGRRASLSGPGLIFQRARCSALCFHY